uniref:ORF20 n=1 Tax=Nitrosopumilaceae spindle-shaped virus TaxID=3065433 RepID=A0AAT9J7J4_9VIRU
MNIILKLINYIDSKKESNPKLFKFLLICLWLVAPAEMLCIRLGWFGFKKLQKKFYFNSTLEKLK